MIQTTPPQAFADAINNVSFSIDERRDMKKKFLDTYSHANITNYLLRREEKYKR